MIKFLQLFLIVFSSQLYAQTGSINGSVKTSDTESAQYVSVSIEGLGRTAITDENGNFNFPSVKAGSYTITAKGVGFESLEQSVVVEEGKRSSVIITLQKTSNELSEVTISSYVAYRNDASNLATRTATPLKEIPQSIQVITQQILKDQQAFTINEVIKNVAGMATFSTYQDYSMRGFRSNDGNFAYNGVRGALYQFDMPGQLYNVEKIEAIKGPASSLFSNASPGGIINIVTKQPLATAKYEVQATYGTYNQKRFMADATGPLSSRVYYRFIAGYENSGAINEQQKLDHVFLAPSIKYNITDRTSATLELNLYNDNRTVGYERGILAVQRADGSYNLDALPIRWSRHNSDDFSKTKGLSGQLRLRHNFNDSFSLNILARTVQSRQEQQDMTSNFGGLVVESDNLLKNRYLSYFKQKPLYAYQANIYAEGKLNTGTIRHNIVGGFDLGNAGRNYYLARWTGPNINVYSPDYSTDYQLRKTEANKEFGFDTRENTTIAGLYMQDQIDLSGKVKALLGLRYDTYAYTSTLTDDNPTVADTRDTSKAGVILPRLGLVYLPHPSVSLYASYSEGFQPQYSNLKSAGGPFDPEKASQYEVGIKAELLEGRLVPTLAFYNLKKTNILIPEDPTDEKNIRQVSSGRARSKGVELTVQGGITQQLSIITNYSYNETKNLNGGEFGAPEGSWYPMAPQTTANTWLKYSIPNGLFKGLSLNGGFQHVGKRNTFTPGFSLPAFTTTDAGLNYRRSGINFGLNVYNLTNVRHYTGGYGRGIFWAGMPRSFRATLGYSF
ncbi:MAG TPA: TonB-dependent receptor [Pedobacter sp.]|jgi:iron complex outermembrane receptor protein